MFTYKEEVRQAVKYAQNEICKHCLKRIVDYHHRLENSKPNRKLFPLFIHSIFNCVGLCRDCHDGPEKEQYKITLKEAEVYERYLEDLIR